MAATIKDIRRETGLSLATISKYLNGGNVLPENKALIDQAIEKLHYQVNGMARGLVTHKSYMIGILAQDISSLFNGTLMTYMGEELRKYGYATVICDSSDDPVKEDENVQFLLGKNVDGIIDISVGGRTDSLHKAAARGVPIVVVDRFLPDGKIDSVTINNRGAAEKALRYLMDRGHTKIAIISSEEALTGRERVAGYRETMEKVGLPVCPEYVMLGHHSAEYGYESMKRLMRLEDPPTAVFMTNYDLNFGAVMALNECGIACPEEVSLVGLDDLLLPRVVRPALTVMKQPMRAMAEKAVELLLTRISEGSEIGVRNIIYDAELLPGESVRSLRNDPKDH